MTSLTHKQRKVLSFLRNFMQHHGMPPTRAEISAALGFASANAAQEHLKTLARKGVLELQSGSSRGIRLLGVEDGAAKTDLIDLPLVGQVAAGVPILAVENVESHHQVSAALFSPRPDYLLRVRGQSMRDGGILHGDLLAVHASRQAESGQIVVARIDDEVTVKRFVRHGSRVSLQAMHPDFAPIEVDLERQELNLEGIAAGVIRRG